MGAKHALLLAGTSFGVLLPAILAKRLIGKSGWSVLAATLLGVMGAYIGGRVQCALQHGDTAALTGGVHAVGMILGSALAYPIACKILGLSLPKVLDLVAIGLGGAVAICRLGCWINGCCAPIQPYFVGAGIVLTAAAWFWYGRRQYDGQVIARIAVGYAVAAAIIEGGRLHGGARIYGIPELQLAALLMVAISASALFALEARHLTHQMHRSPAR